MALHRLSDVVSGRVALLQHDRYLFVFAIKTKGKKPIRPVGLLYNAAHKNWEAVVLYSQFYLLSHTTDSGLNREQLYFLQTQRGLKCNFLVL